ncbi:hypothetical protein I316_07343 [Kwoniella heveanensis BCC8398]|uniref:Zn(2)-C6 fungal-type domain-containing protein n=1 Tax=Kwoniella heveanensis BCC8398 TaxID=1296120 RepID=A0A1B9GJ12_9TREE|nr:hypothetical protein I316_07343 [Kwoniella heveanensis BCC8398]
MPLQTNTRASTVQRRQASTEDDGMDNQETRQPKRKRAAYSCTECAKAKAKCDRQDPCSRCVQRRVPKMCQYLVNGYEDPLEVTKDVQARLDRIESLLLQNLSLPPRNSSNEVSIESNTWSAVASVDDTTRDRRAGYVTGGRYYGPSAMSYVGDGSAVDIMRALDVPDPDTPENKTTGDRRPPRALVDILHELPTRSLCDELIRLYFQNINLTRYPVREEVFRSTYQAMWDGMVSYTLETWIVHRLPLIFVVLAISSLTAPLALLHIDPSEPAAQAAEKRISKSNELFHSSRKASAYSDSLTFGRGDIMLVMADLLSVRYFILVRRAPDALPSLGAAVFRAQALGLHRYSKVSGIMSHEDVQERRLVWSYVYHMDRYCALLLGRPISISDKSCDVEAPLNLDGHGTIRPLTELTLSSFLVARDALAHIMGRIAEEVYQLAEPPYQVIEEIDQQLVRWSNSLPAGLTPMTYQEHDDSVYPDETIRVHRYFLSVEFNFARISLHRPYLIRLDVHRAYTRSRDTCLQAALDDLWARTTYIQPGMENLSMGTYRVTNSLIILGITLLSNPGPDVLRLINECLTSFVAVRKGNTNLLDEVKIKEIAMIEVLRNRADMNLTRANSPAPATTSIVSLNVDDSQATETSTPHPATAGVTNIDPNLQSMFDQFWGSQASVDLYGDQGMHNPGDAGAGGLSQEYLNALLESLAGAPNAYGDGQGGPLT